MPSKVKFKYVPYREASFVEIRRGGFAFVDKTQYIEALEHHSTHHPLIVRPPRSGKTLFTSILQAYYDKAASGAFDAIFSDTYIGEHRTALASQFYALRLNFSTIHSGQFLNGFKRQIKDGIADFCSRYKFDKGYELIEKNNNNDPVLLLSGFFIYFQRCFKGKIYLIIDDFSGKLRTELPISAPGISLTKAMSSSKKITTTTLCCY